MSRIAHLALALTLGATMPTELSAQGPLQCFGPDSPRSPACLMQTVIEALYTAHASWIVPLDTAGQGGELVSMGAAVLYQGARQRRGMEQALEMLRPYATSPDTAISRPALLVAQGILDLRQVSLQGDSIFKDAIDGAGGSVSRQAQRLADMQSNRHRAASYLVLAVVGVTHALTETDPSEPSRIRLNVSGQDRLRLLNQLKRWFGKDLEVDPRTDSWKSDFAAAAHTLSVFLDQQWRTREQ